MTGGLKGGDDFGGSFALFAEGAEAEGIVAFGEAGAGGVEHERGVVEARCACAERAENQELAKGALHEVGAADDFSDLEVGIVDGAGELVAGHAVFAPDEEVAKVAAGGGGLRAEGGVVEGEGFAVGDAEAPVDGEVERRQRGVGGGAELGRVNGFVVGRGGGRFVRRAEGFEDIAAGARAGENVAGGVEAGEGGAVEGEAVALVDDGLSPGEAEPAEVGEHRGDEIEAEAEGVEVVVAEEEGAAGGAGALGGDPEGACVAEVKMAGGRGGQTPAIRRRRRRVES